MKRNLRISLKIYIFTYCIVMLFTTVGGFVLVNSTYRNEFNTVKEQALEDNKTLYIYILTLESIPDNPYMEYSLVGLMQKMSANDTDMQTVVGDFNRWKQQNAIEGVYDLADGQVISGIVESNGKRAVQVTSRCGDRYIINYSSIDDILKRRDDNYELYNRIIIVTSVLLAVILYVFSRYITEPLVKVTKAAEDISGGDYSVRIDTAHGKMKSYETAVLADTLNALAQNTEKYIGELTEEGRRKEEFMGNFTHELKTPMTSIIGYADLIRTYDLTAEQRREYGDYIYREAKRLEQLSLNLLQLLVMGNVEFTMTQIKTMEFGRRLKENLRFLGDKYGIYIEIRLEAAVVSAESAMLSTLVLNLCDNACKASERGGKVLLLGENQGEWYRFSVRDFGRGIPADELKNVTEAFYMVDKSRARKQGGAGLGLALCKKIADIHESGLVIESEVGVGTTVTFSLKKCVPGEKPAEDLGKEVAEDEEMA